LKQSQR